MESSSSPDEILGIYFYQEHQPYFWLSNFYTKNNDPNFKLVIDDQEWPSPEHYYQGQKFKYLNTPSSKVYIEHIRTY